MRSTEGKQRYLADIILHLWRSLLKDWLNKFALSSGATESAAIFEYFPGFFCHKFTIWRVLKPLTREHFSVS